jgi:hypothetical protein
MKQQPRSSQSCPGPKFVRRDDLSPIIRLHIGVTAVLAQHQHQWGMITQLAREYLISRTFVYLLATQVVQAGETLFGRAFREAQRSVTEVRLPYAYALSLRLEGRCSLNAISTIMARFGLAWSSVGKLSETLQAIGGLLASTVTLPPDTVRLVVVASDELFADAHPILLTVDPQSSAILRLEVVDRRTWEAWVQHWECLYDNGCQALYLVCDGGQALAKAHKAALVDLIRQPDTYHAVAHVLGAWEGRLEAQAYAAITAEYTRFKALDSARSEAVITARLERYETACQQADEAITRYDNFVYLYRALREPLHVFDASGQLRDRADAEAQMATALELLDMLGNASLSKAVAKTRRVLPDLLAYFEVARTVVIALVRELPVSPSTFRQICLAHHWHKRLNTAKTPEARRFCGTAERQCLAQAAHDPWTTDAIVAHVYDRLDQVVQSSSLVECVNSLLRPYLNTTRNHINQAFLNLIMFYHNHRRYRAGKRAGHTPMELLTGQPQQVDWLDLLCDEIERKQPDFFASAH